MYSIQSYRWRPTWLTLALVAVLVVMLAACGSNQATGSGPTHPPTYPTRPGYGTKYGCPSDLVVNPLPPAPNVVVNITQRKATIPVHTGNIIEVHLPFGQRWQGPVNLQGGVQLQSPSGYALQDQKMCAWRFLAQSAGTTQLVFLGRAICPQGQFCPQYVIEIPFTIEVQ